jgi:hypothetical protein
MSSVHSAMRDATPGASAYIARRRRSELSRKTAMPAHSAIWKTNSSSQINDRSAARNSALSLSDSASSARTAALARAAARMTSGATADVPVVCVRSTTAASPPHLTQRSRAHPQRRPSALLHAVTP